ncbi:MAG: hypothetical protein IV100_22705 [Myxococcales bacterium]|nr:hypothetical protein [Myxococcales bacterium]
MRPSSASSVLAGVAAATLSACSSASSGGSGTDTVSFDTSDPIDIAIPTDTGDTGDASGGDDADGTDGVTPESPWQVERLSTADGLKAIDGPGDGTYVAVGDRGALVTYGGGTWAPVGRLTAEDLHGVATLPNGDAFVVGAKGTVLRRDSAGWNRLVSGVEDDLHAVAAASADEVWAVGAEGRIVHFDGSTFETEPSNTLSDLFAITVPPGGSPIAGGTGGRVFKRQGGQWVQIQATGPSVDIRDVFATSAQFSVAVGTKGTILVSTGGAWSAQVSNDALERDLYAVFGTSDTNVFAVGDGGIVIRYDGEKWTVMPTEGPLYSIADFRGLSGHTVGEAQYAFAVGAGGAIQRFDGSEWRDARSGPDLALEAVAVRSATDALAVGEQGLALRWKDGIGWSSLAPFSSHDLHGVAATEEGYVIVGDTGLLGTVDASSKVTLVDTATESALRAVAWKDGKGLAVGTGGTALWIDAGTSAEATGVVARLEGVTFLGDGAALVVGDAGTVLRRSTAGEWSPISVPTAVNLASVAVADSLVTLVGDHGTVLEGDGQTFTRVFELPGLFLYGVSTNGSTPVAVGWAGRSIRRTESGWQEDTPATANVLEAIGWAPGGPTFAVGRGGTVLRSR